jgi:hypothetical protein
VLFRQAMFRDCNRRFDFLYGYRYGRFNENLSIGSSTTFISSVGQIPVGTVIQVSDLFEAKNEFNGAEVGFAAKTRYCRWSLELLAKLALGSTRSQVNVNGSTVTSVPGQTPVTSPGGFLALPTNMGTRSENNLSVMPELGVTLGYDITCRWTATFGYSFLYWSKVARPEDQIDTNLNPSQFPPGALSGFPAPQSKYITTDYWAQGLNFGLEYRF